MYHFFVGFTVQVVAAECLADFLTVDIRNIYIGFYGEDGACIRIQIPCGARNQIIGGLIVNKRKRVVYLQDGSTIHGNGTIISTQHGSLGENAVLFSVECTAGYLAVVIIQTGRKCAALDFRGHARSAVGQTICCQSVENTVLDGAALIDDAAFHCIQLAGFMDGVCITEVVGFFAGQIQYAMAHAIGCFINIPAVTIIIIIIAIGLKRSIAYNRCAITVHDKRQTMGSLVQYDLRVRIKSTHITKRFYIDAHGFFVGRIRI